MGEGPEARLTTEFLRKYLVGSRIIGWNFLSGKFVEEIPEGFDEFEAELPVTVKSVDCKGKMIYIVARGDQKTFFIVHHMKVTGRWQKISDYYCTCAVEVEGKDPLWFRDTKDYAEFDFTTEREILEEYIETLGPDILTTDFSLPAWKEIIAENRKKNITAILSDQEIISGVGDYIKSEALYYAKIAPTRKAESLKEHEVEKLYEGIICVSRLAYNYKGISIREYANEYGKKGEFGSQLKIYAKKSARKTKTADGRITYWDSDRQK